MEVDTCRERLAKYCAGVGLDLGFGGAKPIVPHAICIDRAEDDGRRARCDKPYPTHIVSEVDHLYRIFPYETLDFIFSSHVLEDFNNTKQVIENWLWPLKRGGHLVLFLPDQPTYAKYCADRDELPNQAHKHADFGLEFVKARLPYNCAVIHEQFPVEGNPYSFDLVVKKI